MLIIYIEVLKFKVRITWKAQKNIATKNHKLKAFTKKSYPKLMCYIVFN